MTDTDMLLPDLFAAYYDARRNKRNTRTQLLFERDLETNLIDLYHEIDDRRYRPRPCTCFIVHDPVKREVFASDFRDRVVHHLYYNYVSPIFERTFIYDSYSCRKGKGTLFGIERLEHHIRSCSRNYTIPAYVLKLDIQGYFMSIRRSLLRDKVIEVLTRYRTMPIDAHRTWGDVVPFDLVEWLTDVIVLRNPLSGCIVRGQASDWEGLPPTKSLRCSPEGVGLPIGDLTSQLFSNVLLNELDQFGTRQLGIRHYGRYVDDFYLVDCSRTRLQQSIAPIRTFLSGLGLTLHPKKIVLQPVTEPIMFLGAVLHPHYRHARHRTLVQYRAHLREYAQWCAQGVLAPWQVQRIGMSVQSYVGYLDRLREQGIRKMEERQDMYNLTIYYELFTNYLRMKRASVVVIKHTNVVMEHTNKEKGLHNLVAGGAAL